MINTVYIIEKKVSHGWMACADSWHENSLLKARGNVEYLKTFNKEDQFRILEKITNIEENIIEV